MDAVDACEDELHLGFIPRLQMFQGFGELGVLHKNDEGGVPNVPTFVCCSKT